MGYIKDVVNGTINYEETWDGIRALLTSETMFSDIAEGEKARYSKSN